MIRKVSRYCRYPRACRALQEPAPESDRALAPLLDQLFDECIPRSFNAPAPGYLAFIPGGGVFPAALADFIANTANRSCGNEGLA